MENNVKQVSVASAFITLAIVAGILIGGFALWGITNLSVFLLAIIAIAIVGLLNGYTLKEIEECFLDGIRKAVPVAMILMTVGCVIGAWMVSGVVPTIIYYGLKFLSPKVFLLVGFIVTCLVSFFVGSSYSAIATIGVALMGIGLGLGVNPGITAGMVVSGAIFGDKMSPFSDTTNLAPAVAGTDIFSHIHSMLYTTVPATIITAVIFAVMGFTISGSNMDMSVVNDITDTLAANFNLTPLLIIVPLFTIVLAVKKVPPMIALLMGAIFGIICAFIFQSGHYSFKVILNALGTGFKIDSGSAAVDRLVNRGGISGVFSTVALCMLVLGMAEMLQKFGILSVVLKKTEAFIKSPRSLVITTIITCLLTTCITASQYVSIIVPGELMKDAYTKFGVQKKVLSRTLEDAGTIFAFIIPWSTTGIYVSGVLDMAVTEYIPYCFFALLCPVIAVIFALTGFAIFKEKTETAEAVEE